MSKYKYLATFLLLFFTTSQSFAGASLKLQKVVVDVYAIVGELGNRTSENLGNNATFGLVITSEGAVTRGWLLYW